jgi:hypothetical protein
MLTAMFPGVVDERLSMPCLFLAKLGISSIHNLAFLYIIWTFNAQKATYVLSSCNIGGRVGAILAPELAEI